MVDSAGQITALLAHREPTGLGHWWEPEGSQRRDAQVTIQERLALLTSQNSVFDPGQLVCDTGLNWVELVAPSRHRYAMATKHPLIAATALALNLSVATAQPLRDCQEITD